MQVIAERDKKLGKILLGLSLPLIAASIFMLSYSLWYIASLVLGVLLAAYAVYGVFLLPKTAIAKDGDALLLFYAFRQKKIKLSAIEYVSYNEIGTLSTRQSFLGSLHILRNDIRYIVLTVKDDGTLLQLRVNCIINASAVALTINSLVEQAKR